MTIEAALYILGMSLGLIGLFALCEGACALYERIFGRSHRWR